MLGEDRLKIKLVDLLSQIKEDRTTYKQCKVCNVITELSTEVCKICEGTEFGDITDENISVMEAFLNSVKQSKLVKHDEFELDI